MSTIGQNPLPATACVNLRKLWYFPDGMTAQMIEMLRSTQSGRQLTLLKAATKASNEMTRPEVGRPNIGEQCKTTLPRKLRNWVRKWGNGRVAKGLRDIVQEHYDLHKDEK